MMNSNPLIALMNMGQPQKKVPVNPQLMRQYIPQISKENLSQLVQQARGQGISEEDIEVGLNFLLTMK